MTGPLVTVSELAQLLGKVTVLDVRYRTGGAAGPAEFEAGHVPGAAYVDLDADLAAPPGPGGRHPLPDPAHFAAAMRRAGVSTGRPVVVYDDWGGRAAARCWWLLRHHGHPDVRVLDGGWAAWWQSGGAVAPYEDEVGPASPYPGDFEAAATGAMPLVGADEVLDLDLLVDARAPERHRGEVEPIDPVAGRIPGAVNVPTEANLDEEGRFRSAAELRELYEGVGVRPGATTAAYCGSGVTACHDLLAMEVAGLSAALYAGSWSGWITDPSRPVETG
ncbi:sulfurtransferase [Nocardioides coralli]|uniref:sulfurtransferase n=1 Tax=Nocardioides coralli TaxID=2872154 RepID=UPI001CA3B646|nr:sulfurtransferase [Nocardioides coralli]QZY27857.1 sulfurtransferase [Nocardioides coralli]